MDWYSKHRERNDGMIVQLVAVVEQASKVECILLSKDFLLILPLCV